MVGLQPGGLVRHQCVGGGVGLVEAIASELLDQIEYFDCQRGINPLCRCTLFEDASLLRHFFGLFLAHRAAQKIRATQRVTCQHLRDLHYLLLIQNNAVRRLEDRLQPLMLILGVGICQRLPSVLAIDEIFNHARLQGAGTE